jgi:DNA-binding phage protein
VPPAAASPKPEDLQQWQSLDKNNPDALRAFLAKYPNSQWSSEAKRQIDGVLSAREDSDWSAIDHNNPAALQDFLKKHPDGRHASFVTNALADIQRKSQAGQAQIAEEASWKKVNARRSIARKLRERLPHQPFPESGGHGLG